MLHSDIYIIQITCNQYNNKHLSILLLALTPQNLPNQKEPVILFTGSYIR
jgi:phosphoribosylpyrophosphate synthetase